MPPPFRQITLPQFAALVETFNFTRRIVEVHMHHTWRPNRAQYQGAKTINGMWRHHTAVNGWSDIAQHITIAPDGSIWLGRNWNRSPASSGGFNGTSARGPFMFEIIGDFDAGHDPFDGPQRDTVIGVIAHVQRRFGLQPDALRFHNEMSSKSCPGNAISKADVIAAVRAFNDALDAPREGARGTRTARRGPFAASELEGASLREIATMARELEGADGGDDPFDAEPSHDEVLDFDGGTGSRGARGGSDGTARGGLTPSELRLLRPHVVNLRQGRFSDSGAFDTTKEDVDALFDRHLTEALAEATRQNRKLRILFHAHGGLTSETSALNYAFTMRGWWIANGVYPVFFVWETGLTETLKDMFAGAQRGLGRATGRGIDDWLTDHISDPALEKLARLAQGERIWSSMKWSAEKASDNEGGARYVAERLRAFCAQHSDSVALHAVGHSAGSIFHAHFLPCAIGNGGVRFDSLHLLAPAIRVDEFHRRLKPLIGNGIDSTSLFTMDRDTERNDTCGTVYRKSLLYLIHYSLERESEAPILGLQISLERDRELRSLFGLDGVMSPHAEVIWSPTDITTGRSASGGTEHGGFDNDRRTMESVLRRILGVDDHAPIAAFPEQAERSIVGNAWDDTFWVPDEVLDAMGGWAAAAASASSPWSSNGAPAETSVEVPEQPFSTTPAPAIAGTRRALCIGIDEYPTQPLNGCVADARLWKSTLKKLGFKDIRSLENGEATRAAIMKELGRLIDDSSAGDIVVFQYAGHGTQVPDASGDEKSDDLRTGKQDESLCPYDLAEGHLLIDDDISSILARAKPGVSVTLFIDCCHSGTISRFGVSGANGATADDARPRFIVASDTLIRKHLEFRRSLDGGSRAVKRPHGAVLFAACKSWEVAWEKNGQGDFTRLATAVLSKGIAGLTVEKFQQAVTKAFGAEPRQHPDLDCPPAAKTMPLLGAVRAEAKASVSS